MEEEEDIRGKRKRKGRRKRRRRGEEREEEEKEKASDLGPNLISGVGLGVRGGAKWVRGWGLGAGGQGDLAPRSSLAMRGTKC